jgi:predicted membrane channel-forming protein YqfA (hemolysin III family)
MINIKENYYCLTKEKPLLRGIQHLLQFIIHPIFFYYYFYNISFAIPLFVGLQIQLFFSLTYHLLYHLYKYNIKQEIFLQKLDHFGITIFISSIIISYLQKINSYHYIYIYIYILFSFGLFIIMRKNLIYYNIINSLFIIFLIPNYIAIINIYILLLSIFGFLLCLIGIYFYLKKSYKFIFYNTYIFGFHEIFHLFTGLGTYICIYVFIFVI